MQFPKISSSKGITFLRYSLGLFFILFGVDKLFHPINWLGYIPPWSFPLLGIIGLSANNFTYILAITEVLIGALLFNKRFTTIGAYLSTAVISLIFIDQLINSPLKELAIRDFALLTMSIVITFNSDLK